MFQETGFRIAANTKKIIIGFGFAVGLWFSTTQCLFACSCLPPIFPPGASREEIRKGILSKAAIVFSGRAAEIKPNGNKRKVTFAVSRIWKGPKRETLVVETGESSASCGIPFEKGVEYLVYATGADNAIPMAGACSGTKLLRDASEDLKILGDEIRSDFPPRLETHR